MQLSRARIVQFVSMLIIQALVLWILSLIFQDVRIHSFLAALAIALIYSIAQALFWIVFIQFFAWLPVILYPILTFLLSGITVMVVSQFIPDVEIQSIWTALWLVVVMTILNAILAALFSLDEDSSFDRNVTRKMVQRRGHVAKTDVPGFLFLEIDGLSEKIFRRALDEGHMPTLKKMLDNGSHEILGWHTDYTAQTGSMQPGILQGSNQDVPAYRWWDREQERIVMSGNPRDLIGLEARLSNQHGLLSDGGASRGNMFSGDATESLFTFSTLLNRKRGSGPGFYLYLFNPFIATRLIARFFIESVTEWWQAWEQKRRQDKYIVSARNIPYAFFRAFMGGLLQDLTTYTVISDVLRGMPAIYALYAGYDDLGHFAGMETPEAFEMLGHTDHYFARIERALQDAPRPYHIIVLSDHGQSTGPTFKAAHGTSLEELVKGLMKGDEKVFASLDTNEAWDNLNAFLSESVSANTRTAGLMRTMLKSKQEDGTVMVGPDRDAQKAQTDLVNSRKSNLVVLGSGCTGLIYFTDSKKRLTYEEIQERYPDLVFGLINHPGIGFVVMQSEKDGTIAARQGGVNFVDLGTAEGKDPLAIYGRYAAALVKRESSFKDCPDILVNTLLDPQTDELCGFENQVSHHGGLGGPQNHAFIFHPKSLTYNGPEIVGAENVYKVLRGWRDQVQDLEPPPPSPSPY